MDPEPTGESSSNDLGSVFDDLTEEAMARFMAGGGDADGGEPETDEAEAGTVPVEVDNAAADGDATAGAEGEAEAGGEPEEPHTSPGVQKRIDELTAQKNRLKEKLDAKDAAIAEMQTRVREIEAKLQNPEAHQAKAKANDPFDGVQTLEQLDHLVTQYEELEEWALENLDGTTVQTEQGPKEYEAAEVRRMLSASRRVQRQARGKGQEIAGRAQAEQVAREAYPWWENPESVEYQAADRLMAVEPSLAKHPQRKLIVGDLLNGMALRLHGQGQKAAPYAKATEGKEAEMQKAPSSAKATEGNSSRVSPTGTAAEIIAGKRNGERAPAVPGGSAGARRTVTAPRLAESDVLESGGSEDAMARFLAGGALTV